MGLAICSTCRAASLAKIPFKRVSCLKKNRQNERAETLFNVSGDYRIPSDSELSYSDTRRQEAILSEWIACPKCCQETAQASAYCRHCGFLLGETVPVRDMPALSSILLYFALVASLLALWFWLFPPAPAPNPCPSRAHGVNLPNEAS